MALGDPGDKPHHIPGNPSPSMLGGDNRADLGKNHIPGNEAPGLPKGFWAGDEPCFVVEGAPTPEKVRSMFAGSD